MRFQKTYLMLADPTRPDPTRPDPTRVRPVASAAHRSVVSTTLIAVLWFDLV